MHKRQGTSEAEAALVWAAAKFLIHCVDSKAGSHDQRDIMLRLAHQDEILPTQRRGGIGAAMAAGVDLCDREIVVAGDDAFVARKEETEGEM